MILILRLGMLGSMFVRLEFKKKNCKQTSGTTRAPACSFFALRATGCPTTVALSNGDCRKLKIQTWFFMCKANAIFCTLEAWKSDWWIMPNRKPQTASHNFGVQPVRVIVIAGSKAQNCNASQNGFETVQLRHTDPCTG
jgi:hypothetical protein